jgi:hypothetical protein
LHDGLPFWYRGGVPPVPIRWLLVRDPTGELEAQAFLATDLNACPGDILAWFVSRCQVDLVLSGNHAFKVPDAGRSSVTAVTRAAGFDGNHQDNAPGDSCRHESCFALCRVTSLGLPAGM